MRQVLPVAVAALIVVVFEPLELRAQNRNSGGSVPSLFGSRSIGMPSGAGRRTFGGVTAGGLAGTSGVGRLGGGRQANLGSGGLLTGAERFIRGNQQGRFVGRDASEVSDLFRSLTGGAENSGWQNRRTSAARASNNRGVDTVNRGRQTVSGSRGEQRAGRADLHVAFPYQQPVPAKLTAELTARVRRNVQLLPESAFAVELENRTATLRGVVATAHDRTLAEKLVLLEPGVSLVRNQLRVAATPLPEQGPARP